MNDLKPCHCNTTPILQHSPETGYYIHCPNCRSYTHGVQWSREEALAVWNDRPDPWVRIDPERVETLPPDLEKIIVTTRDGAVEGGGRKKAMYGGREIDIILHENGDWTNLEDCLAWQPWPEPAAYEVNE